MVIKDRKFGDWQKGAVGAILLGGIGSEI